MKELFTEVELRRLLEQDEGQFLEFKSLWDLEGGTVRTIERRVVRDWIAEYVAAFANADGGTIILGANDDGKPSGYGYPEEAVQEFLSVPERRLRPPVNVQNQRIKIDEKPLIIIQVPMHPEAVMVESNGFPYRVGDEVIREPQEVINERKQAYRRVGYEQRVQPEPTIDDLDLELARAFLLNAPHGGRPVEEVLEKYGLLIPKAGGSAVKNAALLLFGKQPFSRWHPRGGIRFFRVEGKKLEYGARRNVVQLARLEPPLALLIPGAHAKASEYIRRSEKLHNLFFREMPEYPSFAWQEAIVNAVAHRDYNDQGREIEVWFFDDRMEILSPGNLIPPVTLDHLQKRLRIHASRNPLIVRVLADVGIMREEGEGIPRIYEEMEQFFLRAPEFSLNNTSFCVTLRNQPIFEGPSPEWLGIIEQLTLSSTQKRVLLGHPDGFSNEDYRRLTGLDRDHAYREIQEMIAMGFLISSGAPGRGAVYYPSPNLLHARTWLESRIPKLRIYLMAHEEIDNLEYRRLFELTRYSAVRELKRLVDEGYLILIGAGRGAHYRVGPVLARTLSK